MNKHIKIAPSILAADMGRLRDDVLRAENAGADYLHIDVMDGHFVPNITFGPSVVSALRPHSNLVFDVHLMIEEPEKYIEAFAEAGADIITVHAETAVCKLTTADSQAATDERTALLTDLSRLIRSFGVKSGLSVNPDTPLSVIEDVLSDFDLILVMSVVPGFGGQKYMDCATEKILRLRKVIDTLGLLTEIEVDGGITTDNVHIPIQAGADVIVAGSAVYNSADMEDTIKKLRGVNLI